MEKILMGGIVGFALLTLVSYFLIILKVPYLIIPVIVLLVYIISKPLVNTIKQIRIRFNIQTILIVAVFVLGIAGEMAVISPSGIVKNGDLLFWSANGHDGMWHIALMEEFKRGYPFQNPIFAGEKLVNYHFFTDILPAMINKFLFIDNLNLYFRIMPFIYALFLGASAYFLTKKITNNKGAGMWATIFTYFAGSFGFIVTYIKNKTIGGESIFWATQPQSAGGNPPQIVSDFILLAALYYLSILLRKQGNKYTFWICVLLSGTLIEFKVYAAVVLIIGLFAAGAWQIMKERSFQIFLLAIAASLLGALLYLPNSSGSASFLIFQPWWYIRTMIVEPSRLNLIDWELRRQTYIYEHNWKRVVFLEVLGLTIFFFGNLGTRFIGIWNGLKLCKSIFKNYFNIIFVLIIFLSFVLPLLFLQKGVASNTSQFLQYFVLLMGILAGISASRLIDKVRYAVPKVVLSVILIIVMIPTQIGLLRDFYSRPAFAKISAPEIEALSYVKRNTSKDSVIITPPYNQYLNLGGTTPNIWDWFDTSYVSAMTGRRTYFDDYEQADIMGYNWKGRSETKNIIFTDSNFKKVKSAFEETGASLLYFPKALAPKVKPEELGLTRIFENSEIEVWKTNP